MEAIKNLDERITIFLTGIVWWIDVHFNKNNIWCAKAVFLFIGPILGSLFQTLLFPPNEEEGFLRNFVSLALLLFLVQWFCWWGLFTLPSYVFPNKPVDFIGNAKACPNPNKAHYILCGLKIGQTIFILVLFWSVVDFVTGVTKLTALYLLCTDNIPPAEKKKRKEEKEMRGAVPTLA